MRRPREPRPRRALELRGLEEGQPEAEDEQGHPGVQPVSQIMFECTLRVHALEQPVDSFAGNIRTAAPHGELALDRRARPPRPLRRQRADADGRDEDGRPQVARELFGRALAAPDVRGPTNPGHERDLYASQSGVELERRARRAVCAAGYLKRGGHCFASTSGLGYKAVGAAF